MKSKTRTRLNSLAKAFTLAEVIVAMGIVASVVVAIVGTIPQAVKSIRASLNLTIMGRIAQEVISNIQMSDWADIQKNFRGIVFKYDNDGLNFEALAGQVEAYQARVIIEDEPVRIKDFSYRPEFLKRMRVEVEFTPGGFQVLNEKAKKENTKVFYFLVGNQNRTGVLRPTPN